MGQIIRVSRETALRGRSQRPYTVTPRHVVLGRELEGPVPAGLQEIYLGMGCFWGAERHFWRLPGVWTTSVGYQGGFTENPLYEEVCTGRTGHSEVVRVVFDPAELSLDDLLAQFWTAHDPTQGDRQGNDVGTQYRSVVFTTSDEQAAAVAASAARYQSALTAAGRGRITTEIAPAADRPYYLAEDYHQQYLSDLKNPFGYCGLKGTGVACPVAPAAAS